MIVIAGVLASITASQTGCTLTTYDTAVNPFNWRPDWAITHVTNSSMDGGGTYTGPLLDNGDGQRHAHGFGTRVYSNGDKYVGQFEYGYMDGEGTYTFANGNVEKGHFRHGELEGEGTNTLANGDVTKGQWRHDYLYTGQSTTTNPNGTDLIWEYEDGRLVHSKGTCVCDDGTKYVGEWCYDGRRSGGTITWADGRTYKGQWRVIRGEQDPPEGDGEMAWPDGRKYVGDFRDGLCDGLGKMTCKDGKVLEGFWKKGEFVGTLVKADQQPTSRPTSAP